MSRGDLKGTRMTLTDADDLEYMSTCSYVGYELTELSTRQVADLADVFRQLGEPNRLRLVLACLDQPRGVGALTDLLGLSQTLVSHHLRLLRTAHILRGDRRGREVIYTVDDQHVSEVVRNMVAHVTEPHHHRTASPAKRVATD